MTDPSLNQDIKVPARPKIPLPKTSPPDLPTNCRFKPGQIVRLRCACSTVAKDSIGVVYYYLPKKYIEEGVCWIHTLYLDLMTDEEPKSLGIIETVHQNHLELCKHLPSWLPYELDKETGRYKLDVKTVEAAIKRLHRV